MAGTIYETAESQSGSREYAGAGLVREFFVFGEPDVDAVQTLIEGAAAVTFKGHERKSIQRQAVSYDVWRATVTYGSAANGNGGLKPDQFNFKVGVATRHFTQSLQTLYRMVPNEAAPPSGAQLAVDGFGFIDPSADYTTQASDVGQSVVVTGGAGWTVGAYLITSLAAGPGSPWGVEGAPALPGATGGVWHLSGRGPDNAGAIGTSLDAVQGCDVAYPVAEFSVCSRVPLMTFAQFRSYRPLVRTTNAAEWNGFAAGELLYLGCEPTGAAGTLADAAGLAWWNVNHNFRYEPNQTNVRVGDVVLPAVGGHEYVWARYGGNVSALVPTGGGFPALVQKPTAVYVERVYGAADFDDLGVEL